MTAVSGNPADQPRVEPATRPWWPFARHSHECVTGRLSSHMWACRGWRCWGFPFRACRTHRGRRKLPYFPRI
jgi:hypothetical protein